MKKVYYFSESELKYVQIKKFRSKYIVVLFTPVLLLVFLQIIGINMFQGNQSIDTGTINSSSTKFSVKKEAEAILAKYKMLEQKVNALIKQNNDLRITANLQPLDEESMLGTGGGLDMSMFKSKDTETKDLDDIEELLENFSTKIDFEKSQYKEISNRLKQNNTLFQALPAVKPCTGNLAASGFGMRLHPILKIRRMHNGIDIITNTGTPVHAAGNGKIVYAGKHGGYGIEVEIDHGFGYRSIYGHLSKVLVNPGQTVKRGSVIAESGNTGLSTGPHLHYEVHHNGEKLNPADFFFDDLSLFEK